MDDILNDAKRIKFLEQILVAIGANKMVFKDLEKADEHLTMLITKSGILDIHKKLEESGQYESLGKFDLSNVVKEFSDPEYKEKLFDQLAQGVKRVTFDEPEYSHLTIANMQIKEKLLSQAKKTGRNVTISPDAVKGMTEEDVAIPWNKAKGRIDGSGIVLNKGELDGWIFEEKGIYLYLPLSALWQTALGQMIKDIYQLGSQENSKVESNS